MSVSDVVNSCSHPSGEWKKEAFPSGMNFSIGIVPGLFAAGLVSLVTENELYTMLPILALPLTFMALNFPFGPAYRYYCGTCEKTVAYTEDPT